MSTIINTPYSTRIDLAANEIKVFGGSPFPAQLLIPPGSTVTVALTLAPGDEVQAGTAPFVTWSDGAKPGPYLKEIGPCTAVRLTNGATAGYVYIMQ